MISIIHNAKFDYKFLKWHYGIEINSFCTFITSQLISNGFNTEHSLEFLLDRYFGIKLNKKTRNSFIGKPDDELITPEEIDYACEDIIHLPKLRDKQMEFIRKYNMEFLLELEQNFLPILAEMELNGQNLDIKRWLSVAEDNKAAARKVEKRLDKLIRTLIGNDLSKIGVKLWRGREVTPKRNLDLFTTISETKTLKGKKDIIHRPNYSSSPQVIALCKQLGASIDSTEEEYLSEFIKNNPSHKAKPFINLLITYREVKKAYTSFGQKYLKYINPVTGNIHSTFTQCMTTTGRLSSTFPNVQQIPKFNKYRNCFIALPGRVIVTIDYSNCELRILASNSQDKVLLDNFNAGGDFHGYLAQIAYSLINNTNEKVSKAFRDKMKNVNFAICYGATGYRISKYLNVPKSLGEQIYRNMRNMLPDMFSTLDSYEQFARSNGYIIANERTKRRRWFGDYILGNEYPDYKIRTESMNMPIQATNIDLVKESCIEIDKAELDAKLVSIIHDELVFDVNKEKSQEITKELVRIMEITANRYLRDNIKMKAEAQIKPYWNK